MGAFQSTPTFELFKRGLEPRVVKRFRGINVYKSRTLLTPDWAQDCLNVLVPGSGGLSKFRLPVSLSPAILNINSGPNQFFDFQQGTGTRQVVASFGTSLYYYTWNGAGTALNAATLIETAANDAAPWSFVESNNILFAANGQRMMKWTGTKWQAWGIAAPLIAPKFGGTSTAVPTLNNTQGWVVTGTVQRAAGTVTLTLTGASAGQILFAVGDVVTIVADAGAGTFVGSFAITVVTTPGQVYQYAQAGANLGPIAATVTAPSMLSIFNIVAATGAGRANGLASLLSTVVPVTFPNSFVPNVTVTGVADATFNGTFPVIAFNPAAGTVIYAQPGLPDTQSGGGTFSFGITDSSVGRQWAYAYVNTVTGAVSNMSPPLIGPPMTNRVPALYPTLSVDPRLGTVDPQINAIQWYATLDGGGDFFAMGGPLSLYSSNPFNGSATTFSVNGFFDVFPDSTLTKTIRGALVNNPPPVGKYLAVGQSRVVIFNLVGAPNQIAYSGYEQILSGRPEESFPPNNRLLLSIGAEAINGGGIIQAGIVAFSATKRMYMLRGNLEDITLAAPVQFSAFLEELPWNMGTLCHDSIQSTPYGLLFWATDKTVNVFDGYNQPNDLSEPVYPILRRATPGQEVNAKSCYFNWLERDWYGLTFAIDGSLANNYTIFWALHRDTGQIDIFPCGIQMDSMMTLSTPTAQRILAIGQGGVIKNLPVSQDTVGGIADLAIIPATNGNLQAYWRNGYFGEDSPQRAEMFRWLRLITDQPPQAFKATLRLVDDDLYPITQPYIVGPTALPSSKLAINRRAKRCSVEINFPQTDVSANVLELQVMSVPSADR